MKYLCCNSTIFYQTDIKAVKVMKKCVFIKTTTKQMILFPRTDEVLQLFAEK